MESVATRASGGLQFGGRMRCARSDVQISELEQMADQPSIRQLHTFLYDVFQTRVKDINSNQTTILADYVRMGGNDERQNEQLQTVSDTSLDASSMYADILMALMEVLTVLGSITDPATVFSLALPDT